jgi:N-acetylglucosaminyldiphosphoundecaprenol N-acetyl-beta-D-mannosaminyltransferase
VLGAGVDLVGVEELEREILRLVRAARGSGRRALVLNVNAHCLNLAYRDPALRRILDEAALVFCDGAGVALGARLLGQPAPERITYADWMWSLAALAARKNLSIYLLGSRPGVAEEAARRLRQKHPALTVAGTGHGYFDKSPGSEENEAVLREISAAAPDVLVAGFGMPLQERWLADNRDRLGPGVALAGGAAFDYVSGRARRGPRLLTDNGFEWLARLFLEPGRLWRRYLLGNPLFVARILRERISRLRASRRAGR